MEGLTVFQEGEDDELLNVEVSRIEPLRVADDEFIGSPFPTVGEPRPKPVN